MAFYLPRVLIEYSEDPEHFIARYPQRVKRIIYELGAMHDNVLEQLEAMLKARDAKIAQLEAKLEGVWTTCSQCGEHDSDDYYFAPSGLCCDCEEKRLAAQQQYTDK